MAEPEEREEPDDAPKPKRTRMAGPRKNYWNMGWGLMLLLLRERRRRGDPDRAGEAKFKSRCRLPYELFEEIVEELRGMPGYVAENAQNSASRPSIPLEHVLMSVLRVAGRGWCFDDVEEASGIGRSTISAKYHTFVAQYVQDWYQQWVSMPDTPEGIKEVTDMYEVQGVPGAVGSIDCVHRAWRRCPWNLRHLHVDKEGFPTRAYEVVSDNRRRVRSVTPGYPGAYNDKTVVRHDYTMSEMRKGKYAGVAFKLRAPGNVLLDKLGLFLICDGGYHKWLELQCPWKQAVHGQTSHSKLLLLLYSRYRS